MAATEVEAALARLVRHPWFPGAALSLAGPGGEAHLGAGTLTADTPAFFASTTKLFVTVILRRLEAEGLSLDTPFRSLLPGPETERLCVAEGRDLTDRITLRHLMAHVSGLPDYLGSADRTRGLIGQLVRGEDRAWTLGQALDMARAMGPVGRPGEMARGHYSDTNYQLLGAVIEAAEDAPLGQVIARRITGPLGLRQTWLYDDPTDRRPVPPRWRERALEIPQALVSSRADGALVSTPREGVAFLRALWGGAFGDPAAMIAAPTRRIFFPLRYGDGVMLFALPRWMTLFRRLPAFWGHSGMTGALMFHAPQAGLSVAATVNQIDRPGTSFRLLLKAL